MLVHDLAWPSAIAFVAASGFVLALLDPGVNRLFPCCFVPHPGTRAPSLHRSYPASSVLRAPPPPTRASDPKPLLTCRRSPEWAARVSRLSLLACCRPPPRRSESVMSSISPTRTSLPLVQAGSAFASCISGPPRRSLALRPANSQTAFRRLLSPRLRPLRYLHDRWDSYPVGTTFTGAGLAPAGKTDLCTAHLDKHTFRKSYRKTNRRGLLQSNVHLQL